MTSIKDPQQRKCKSAWAENNCQRVAPHNALHGGVLIEILIALFIFMSASAYLLSSEITTRVLWQATLKAQEEQTQQTNAERLDYTQDHVDQSWRDIAVFGIPTTTP